MSDFVDDIFMQIGNDQCPEWEQYQAKINVRYSFMDNKDYWVTAGGKKIYPRQMDSSHIEHTIKMIERSCIKNNLNPADYKIYNLLVKELKSR